MRRKEMEKEREGRTWNNFKKKWRESTTTVIQFRSLTEGFHVREPRIRNVPTKSCIVLYTLKHKCKKYLFLFFFYFSFEWMTRSTGGKNDQRQATPNQVSIPCATVENILLDGLYLPNMLKKESTRQSKTSAILCTYRNKVPRCNVDRDVVSLWGNFFDFILFWDHVLSPVFCDFHFQEITHAHGGNLRKRAAQPRWQVLHSADSPSIYLLCAW